VATTKRTRIITITFKARPVKAGPYYVVYLPARWKNEVAKVREKRGMLLVTVEIPVEEEVESNSPPEEGEKKP